MAKVIPSRHLQVFIVPILSRGLKLLTTMVHRNWFTKHKIQIKENLKSQTRLLDSKPDFTLNSYTCTQHTLILASRISPLMITDDSISVIKYVQ